MEAGQAWGMDGNSVTELGWETHTPLELGLIGWNFLALLGLSQASSLHCVLWVPLWRGNCCQDQGSSGYLSGGLRMYLLPRRRDPPL